MTASVLPIDVTASSEASLRRAATTRPVQIRDESPRDRLAREALLDRAFGLERFAKTCERLREGRLPAEGLSFTATLDGRLVGTLRLWSVEAGGRPALLLGPLAVDHRLRSAGIGGALMRHGLARAAALGHGAVLLVGDAPYYERFGFDGGLTTGLVLPGPVDRARFLGRELVPGRLAGAAGRVVATGRPELRRDEASARLAA